MAYFGFGSWIPSMHMLKKKCFLRKILPVAVPPTLAQITQVSHTSTATCWAKRSQTHLSSLHKLFAVYTVWPPEQIYDYNVEAFITSFPTEQWKPSIIENISKDLQWIQWELYSLKSISLHNLGDISGSSIFRRKWTWWKNYAQVSSLWHQISLKSIFP